MSQPSDGISMDEKGLSGLQIGTVVIVDLTSGLGRFLKTPLEIRNQIYGYLLSAKHTKVDVVGERSVSVIFLTPLAVLSGER